MPRRLLRCVPAHRYAAAASATGPIDKRTVMARGTPQAGIASAIIFNARIIPRLVPLRIRFGERAGAAKLIAQGRGTTDAERAVDALWQALIALARNRNTSGADRV